MSQRERPKDVTYYLEEISKQYNEHCRLLRPIIIRLGIYEHVEGFVNQAIERTATTLANATLEGHEYQTKKGKPYDLKWLLIKSATRAIQDHWKAQDDWKAKKADRHLESLEEIAARLEVSKDELVEHSAFGLATSADEMLSDSALDECMAILPDHLRETFALYKEGMSHGEIAGILGINVKTSRSRIYTAKRTLETYLQKKGIAK